MIFILLPVTPVPPVKWRVWRPQTCLTSPFPACAIASQESVAQWLSSVHVCHFYIAMTVRAFRCIVATEIVLNTLLLFLTGDRSINTRTLSSAKQHPYRLL